MCDRTALTCPYYQGVGRCVTGCWEEPACQVDEPLNGWRWRDERGRFAKADPAELKALAERAQREYDEAHPRLPFPFS